MLGKTYGRFDKALSNRPLFCKKLWNRQPPNGTTMLMQRPHRRSNTNHTIPTALKAEHHRKLQRHRFRPLSE